MPKRRSKKPAKNPIENEYRDLDDTVDPEDEDYMYDAVEKFHNKKEQRILGKFEEKSDDESSEEEEEILPVGDDNDDDESDDAEAEAEEDYGDDASLEDDESEEEDSEDDGDYDGSDDDNLPGVSSSKAWGKKRSTYYGADKLDGLEGFDRDEAQDQEEAEALKIQKRLMKEIDVTKFNTFKKKTQEKQKQSAKEDEGEKDKEEGEKVEVDVASLSLEEQQKLVKQLHPEVEPLLQNYEVYWGESRKLRKMVELINKNPGKFGKKVSAFVVGRFKLCSFYCMYISHYISVIARKASLKGHEILSRLTECIKLLNEGEDEYKRLEVQIDWALRPEQNYLFEASSDSDDMEVDTDSTQEPPRRRRRDVTATTSSWSGKLKSLQDKIDEEEQEEEIEDSEEEDEDESRRAVNRQIEKNVGLKPKKSLKRRQMERNPRVKHREKFRRAAIRRKGQVRPHRTETNKYTGEQSGIREGIIRSIKLK